MVALYSLSMTLARDTAPKARRIQLDALRRLDGPARLEIACQMSDEARLISKAGIRHRHPEWTSEQVHRALMELLLGRETAQKALGPRATPA